jgi:sulfite exporter TauE/SafE/copper chaperone CopZ
MKKTFTISGMHCNSCAQLIEKKLKNDVNKISVSYADGKAVIEYDESKISEKRIKEKIKKLGFGVTNEKKENKPGLFSAIILLAIALLIIYFLFIGFDINGPKVKIPESGEKADLVLLFIAGLLTGFHCVSMCGGFVVSYTMKNAMNKHKGFGQHLVYGGSKVVSYALIGGIFGLVGGAIALSPQLRGMVAILSGLFMVFYALSMFGVGFFRKFQFNPKFLSKIASEEHEGFYRAPFITGILSGLFIACGPLQAMYFYAAGTGSFIAGAVSLAVFGLGTLPVLLGFGGLATVVSQKTTGRILKISAVIVLLLGLLMINRGLELSGSTLSFSSLTANPASGNASVMKNGTQEISMVIDNGQWKPTVFVLAKGVPVRWTIDLREQTSCSKEILINDYNMDIKLKQGINVVEFTPNKTGTVKWTCWMGMISGSFIITETGQASAQQIASEVQNSSGKSNMPQTGIIH